MKQRGSRFRMAAEKLPAALAEQKTSFKWVDSNFAQASTVAEILEAWRWEGEFDPITGDLTDIHFIGEKLGDEEILFQALAPFVDKESFIEMEGEDGDLWRWTFDGQQMIEQVARITWG
ncbi:MAG: hypothetical protein ACYCOU_19240 [Sulfobacillus sp.]